MPRLRCLAILVILALAASAPAAETPSVVFQTATAANEDPFAAGKAAAETLKQRLGGLAPHVVLFAECFEDKENKEKALAGAASVLGAEKIVGGSSYGAFTQDGVVEADAVAMLAVAGPGVTASVAVVERMGAAGLTLEKDQQQLAAALGSAGRRLAAALPQPADGKLLLIVSDAHSPKNQLLLDGVQAVVGKKLPITGGSVNKNAGQNWVYFRGQAATDAAVAVLLKGEFALAQAGRQAKDNDRVLATAREGAGAALERLGRPPLALLAFDCAGRKGKLKSVEAELAAIQAAAGRTVVLFGCYCAGEYGPADEQGADSALSCGRGWHAMFTAVGR